MATQHEHWDAIIIGAGHNGLVAYKLRQPHNSAQTGSASNPRGCALPWHVAHLATSPMLPAETPLALDSARYNNAINMAAAIPKS